MRTQSWYLPLALALSAALVPASGHAQQTEEFRWTGTLAAGRTVEVRSLNGGIVAERGAGSTVEVVAVKSARRSDPADVQIEVVEHAGGITVCAVYPTPAGSRPNECGPGVYEMNTRDNDVSVEIKVLVPDGVHLLARSTNGGIEATGLTGQVDARTTNGGIHVSTTGLARAHTTNGSIDVTLGDLGGTEPLEFSTTNGAVTVTVPDGVGIDLSARTTNGAITSDLPIMVEGTFGRGRLSGQIGGGGREVVLQTTNGDVRLLRGLR